LSLGKYFGQLVTQFFNCFGGYFMAMEETALDDLKSMLGIARRGALNFGVCMGKKPEDTVMILHRKKPPETLQRLAKKDGDTAKTTCGIIEVAGKKANLQCLDDPPPGLPKALKRFFADTVGMALKVTLVSADGTVLESDGDDDEVSTAARDAPEEGDEVVTAAPEEAEEAGPDPRLAALTASAKELAGQIGTVADPATRAKLVEAFKKIVERINRGDADTAEPALQKLQAMVARFAGAPAPGTVTPDMGETPEPDGWAAIAAKTEPQVLAALKANHHEAAKIRAIWGFAQEKAEAGDTASAIKAVERLAPLLADTATPAKDAPPTNVVAFQRSRILWIDAKKSMQSDMEKFRASVAQQSADDSDQTDIMAAVDNLVKEFSAFDTKLEDVLDEITQTPEGALRSKLKKDADKAIGAYLTTLETPFFQIIDSNPFVAVNVASRGKQSLSVVKATLA